MQKVSENKDFAHEYQQFCFHLYNFFIKKKIINSDQIFIAKINILHINAKNVAFVYSICLYQPRLITLNN